MTIDGTLLAAYDQQMRTALPTPPAGVRHEQDGPLLRIVGMYRGLISAPRDVGVRGTELDRLIARQRDYFAARGEAVGWRTRGHDEPADLPSRLQAAGFVPEEESTVLIGLVAEIAASPVVPEGVVLRAVTADADMRRIAEMESAAWGRELPGLADDLIGRIAAAPDDIAVLAAEADGDVVSAAWLVFKPGTDFASLWGGTTLPRWHGRGIYRALVAARAQRAAARGVRYLQVDASDDSAPILRRLGFHAVTTTTHTYGHRRSPVLPDEPGSKGRPAGTAPQLGPASSPENSATRPAALTPASSADTTDSKSTTPPAQADAWGDRHSFQGRAGLWSGSCGLRRWRTRPPQQSLLRKLPAGRQ